MILKTRRCYAKKSLVQIALIWVAFAILPVVLAEDTTNSDIVLETIREYEKESLIVGQSDNYEVYRNEFFQKWFDKLWSVREKQSDNQKKLLLTKKLLGLSNGLKMYDISEELADELLNSSNDVESKNRWHQELGDIFYNQYIFSQKKDTAEKAAYHYNRAIEEIAKINNAEYLKRRAGYTLSSINRLGDIKSIVSGKHILAADLFKRGNEVLARLPQEQRSVLERRGWSSELWLSKEMTSSVKGDDITRAYSSLNSLSSLENLRRPPGYYMGKLAATQFPEGGGEYRKSLQDWIDSSPPDKWVPVLLFKIATDFEKEGKQFDALGIYWKIVNNYKDALIELEPDTIKKGRGGYLANALFHLIHILAKEGLNDKALLCSKDFLELFPDDSRAMSIKNFADYIESQDVPFNSLYNPPGTFVDELPHKHKAHGTQSYDTNALNVKHKKSNLPTKFEGDSKSKNAILIIVFVLVSGVIISLVSLLWKYKVK